MPDFTLMPSRPCPTCGGASRDRLYQQRFERIEGVSILGGYDVVACGACGMVFADGVPGAATFDRYYREASKYAYPQRGGAESPADAARLAITADKVAALVPDRATRILDAGCASGRLLAELRLRGYSRLAGIDPSPEAIAAARRVHQVSAEVATLAAAAAAGAQADVVVLIGVLEHLVDLDGTTEALHAILPPGGRVYLEVPDVVGFADWPNAPYQELSVEHVNFFSAASLAAALERRGFPVRRHERNTRWQTPVTRVANLSALAVRGAASAGAGVDTESRPAMLRYLDRSARADALVRERLRALAGEHPRVAIWGAGSLTLRLLAAGAFDAFEVVAFADSNLRYHGATIRGVPVVAPDALRLAGVPVLVSSWGFAPEMTGQLGDSQTADLTLIPVFDAELSRILSNK